MEEVLEAARACEKAFVGALQSRDALGRALQLVESRLRTSEQRFEELVIALESNGAVVCELLEEKRELCGQQIREARRALAKALASGLPAVDCLPMVEGCEQHLIGFKEALDEARGC